MKDGTGRQASILDEHVGYLRERWNSGCTNAAQLWAELRDRGYPGGPTYVRQYLARFRGNAAAPQPKPTAPKVRAVTSWIMTSPGNLADAGKASLEAILAASPALAAVAESVRAFAAIMNERRGRKLLEPWMTAVDAAGEPALRSFVTGLRADQDAVTNGLSLRWSSGAVEGHVNPHQNAQTANVRTRRPRHAPPPRPALGLTAEKTARKVCQNQNSADVDIFEGTSEIQRLLIGLTVTGLDVRWPLDPRSTRLPQLL